MTEQQSKIIKRSWYALGIFFIGLLLHELCVKVLVDYIGEGLAIWADGVIQTIVTIIVIHYLLYLFWQVTRDAISLVVGISVVMMVSIFASFWAVFFWHIQTFIMDMHKELDQTGWLLFFLSCAFIGGLTFLNTILVVNGYPDRHKLTQET